MDLDRVETEDLLEALERRYPAFVFAAVAPRDAVRAGYYYHTWGNMATKSGLVVMLDDFLREKRNEQDRPDSDIPPPPPAGQG